MNSATAFAPATVANVAVGFDILGFAIETVGDVVTVAKIERPIVIIREVIDTTETLDDLELFCNPAQNTATVGLIKLRSDLQLDFGFEVTLRKGIAIGSGMGGSAASAVGAMVAANELLPQPLPKGALMKYALLGEQVASGSTHADNAAPCLFGGLTLALDAEGLQIIPIPVPSQILAVVVHPHQRVDTRRARSILQSNVRLSDHVRQSAYLGGFIAGCFAGDLELIRQSFRDVLIEPQRSALIPAFVEVKAAALKSGAIGVSISGSGPSMFAWTTSPQIAAEVRDAMVQAYRIGGFAEVDSWISPINRQGARIIG